MTSQDFQKGLDLTGQTSVNASQLNQLVDSARPAASRGIVVVTTDTAVNTPDVPDSTYQNYLWRRIKFAGDPEVDSLTYAWNDAASSDPVVLKWRLINESQISAEAQAAIANAVAAYFLANPISVNQDNSDFVSEESPLPVFEIYSKSRPTDPRSFGADPDGLVSSSSAIRKAIKYASTRNNVVEFTPGEYLLEDDVWIGDRLGYYLADESSPFNPSNANYVYRDQYEPIVPLLDNTVLTSRGGAVLKYEATSRGDRVLLSALGRENCIVEGLTLDGNVANQPNRNATYIGANGDNAIFLGNYCTLRHCIIQNFVGQQILQGDYYPNTSLVSEPFVVLVASFCNVHDNVIKHCFGGGFAPFGQFSLIKNNRIEDILGNAVSFFCSIFNNAGHAGVQINGAMDYKQVIFHYLTQLGYHKGRKLGTIVATTDGVFYAPLMTDAALESIFGGVISAPSDQDKSVRQYYSYGNQFRDNIIKRYGSIAINMESSCADYVYGNTIFQGIPQLQYPNATPTLYNGSCIRHPGARGILCAQNCRDPQIENNTIHISQHLIPKDASSYYEMEALQYLGYGMALGGHLDDPANYDQSEILEAIFRNNKVISAERVSGNALVLNSGWGANYPVELSSITSGPSVVSSNLFPANVTEITAAFDPEYEVASAAHIALRGSFKFTNPVSEFSTEYYAMAEDGSGGETYKGYKQRIFKTFLVPANRYWTLDYLFSVYYSGTLYAMQKGSIKFKYDAGMIDTFEHIISEVNFMNGVFEIEALADEILVDNKTRSEGSRLLPLAYRGGIKVYFNPFDQTLYGMKNDGTMAYNSNLVFKAEGFVSC